MNQDRFLAFTLVELKYSDMIIGMLRDSNAVLGAIAVGVGVGGWLNVDAVGKANAIIYLLLFIVRL